MHYRLFITLVAEPTDRSNDVRRSLFHRLSEDDSFCGEGGRFGTPLADWFVIGGRWSGCLAEARLGETFRTRLHAELPNLAGGFGSGDAMEANADALARLWAECGGTGSHPFLRNSPGLFGAEDDATPLTRELLDTLLAPYHGHSEFLGEAGHCEYVDLEYDTLSAHAVGRKWLAVVDYHS